MKKHKTQMSERELDLLTTRVDETDIPSVEITKYTLSRFNERFDGISLLDVAEVFIDYNIIEFNTNNGDSRVLLRGTKDLKTDEGCYNVCIVYSLRNNRIVTAWLNNYHDHHKTLRIEEYSADLRISW